MMGRMAYVIMCVEKYLLNKYPNRNWKLFSEILWKSTSTDWAFWTDMYSAYIPDVLWIMVSIQKRSSEIVTMKRHFRSCICCMKE